MLNVILDPGSQMILQLIPDEDPTFPGIPIEERFSAEFLAGSFKIEEGDETFQVGMIYDAETHTAEFPPIPEPPELPDPEDPTDPPVTPPTSDFLERLEKLEAAGTVLQEQFSDVDGALNTLLGVYDDDTN